MLQKERKNILLYGAGTGVSMLGSMIYSFAIGLYVLDRTGSGFSFATNLILAFIPMLVITPFAGVLADRFDRKKIVVGMDALNGVLFTLLFIYIQSNNLSLGIIYLTTFITNILTTYFGIAFESAKPQLVTDDRLQQLNGLSQIVRSATGILSPMLGGFVYALIDIKLFILINGISFFISAFSELFIDFTFNQKKQREKRTDKVTFKGVLQEMKAGYHYLMGKKGLIKLFGIFMGLNIAFSFAIQIPLPYLLNNHFEVSKEVYGLINGFFPIGMIIGALTVGQLTKRFPYEQILLKTSYFTGVLLIIMGLPFLLPLLVRSELSILIYYASILLIFGMNISYVDVPVMTIIQSSIEEEYRGRAFGILMPMIKVVNPMAYLVAGGIIVFVNPLLIMLITGLAVIVFMAMKRRVLLDKTLAPSNEPVTQQA